MTPPPLLRASGPEAEARVEIDAAFVAVGWAIQTWSEKRNPEGRWRSFTFNEIAARGKCSLDLFWIRDEFMEDSASLSDPHILTQEITDGLRSALGQIEDILCDP